MSEAERFDELLLNIAGQCGGIEPLFDTVFSFLFRKTDFFHVMQEGDRMGFPDGVAEKILLHGFRKYQMQAKQIVASRKEEEGKQKAKAEKAKAEKAKAEKVKTEKVKAETPPAVVAAPPPVPAAAAPSAAVAEAGSTNGPAPADAASVEAAQQTAVRRGHLKDFVEVPYNGSTTGKYTWEQTINDVTINVKVPKGTKARDVVCVISKGHVSLKLKGAKEALLDGDFPLDARNGQEVWEKVRADECYWNLSEAEENAVVSIYLEKERETWWKAALEGDAEIDTTKVDSTRSMYDYDDETQGAIRKIMFDQDQKRKGLPASDDLKNEDMLRKAWDAEGSPFKGTPFDPSAINMGGPGAPGMGAPPGIE